jgi:hypothetical protein
MVRLLLVVILLMSTAGVGAFPMETWGGDTAEVSTEQHMDSVKRKKGLLAKLSEYISNSNNPRPDKKFDFGLLAGPHYSSDKKLGLGLVATGLYRTDRSDTLLPPSNVALYGDITTGHFYKIGIHGTHIFPHDTRRIDYDVSFDSFKGDFWGIGYDNGNNDHNKSTMKRLQVKASVSLLWRLAEKMYIGPMAEYDYVYASEVERPEFLNGMDRGTWNIGGGIAIVYDSRDVLTNPHRGVYVNLSQLFRPAFMGNDYVFSTTDLRADAYHAVWKGGLVAADLRGTLNFGSPSWGMMSLLGTPYSMRGYYEGRYRDKHKIEAQVELRQHVWRRHGFTVWAGAGTVFSKFGSIRFDRLLPNFGMGYRWEFKKDVNLRLDYGFGKCGQQGLVFNINEAF